MASHFARNRFIAVILMVVAISVGALTVQTTPSASALSGSGFSAGNIISDSDFYDGNAMSQAEIQTFLNSKIGNCANGQCLNVLSAPLASRAKLVSDSTGNLRCDAITGGTLSAAAIIYRVQVACGISAEVILVTLQKEQGLVTSSSPSQAALDRAMGFACPDTAPCAVSSLGFGNQVYTGALQLKTYKASNFGVQPGVRNVLYNPNSSCGYGAVNIQNYATAALYNYTPYQPNSAALANLTGTGDECSSYGNRNFWVYLNTWFGIHVEPGAIATLYSSLGGSAGALGAVAANVDTFTGNGGGTGQRFQNGSITSSPTIGTVAMLNGALRNEFFAEGGPSGPLGWPAAALETFPGGTGMRFQNGSILASPAGAFGMPNGDLRNQYFAAGGPSGTYGWPIAAQVCVGTLCSQKFQGGSIDLNPISVLYKSLGGAQGVLGAAQTGMEPFSGNGGGTGQRFANGSITSSVAAGTWAMMNGPMRDEYFASGGPSGSLGWPTAAQLCANGVCSQTFQGGSLPGPISVLYASLGGDRSSLGAAQTGIEVFAGNGGGTGQRFANGSITSSRAAGTWVIMNGSLRDEYFARGGPSGPLGWPTAAQVCSNGVCSQTFQSGTLPGPISVLYASLGGARSSLGMAQTGIEVFTGSGGGIGQRFANGSITSSPTAGTWAMMNGPIRNQYFDQGGPSGFLGWPTAAQACTNGVCSQTFQGGSLIGQIATQYAAMGGSQGVLGAAQTGVQTFAGNGGGFGQRFTNGSITSSTAAGTWAIMNGPLRDQYFSQNGPDGTYGWPTAAAVCSSGRCTQQFQGGSITAAQ